jgi:hypothetical protein
MKTLRALSVSERLAVMAGVAATFASVAGFIPGVYPGSCSRYRAVGMASISAT